MRHDHEFDPTTDEQRREREQEAEFARRVRREVRRMERGEADEDIRADEQTEAEEHAREQAKAERERRRSGNIFRHLFSGTILIQDRVSKYYSYLGAIAAMFLLSIIIMFMTLRLDMRHTHLDREVKFLRERSIRLEQQRYSLTRHSAIDERQRERGLGLIDAPRPNRKIDK